MLRTLIVVWAALCVVLCGNSYAADPLVVQLKWLADAQSASHAELATFTGVHPRSGPFQIFSLR
jgi:hypothetical protein